MFSTESREKKVKLEKLQSGDGEEDLITPQIYQIVPLDLILDAMQICHPQEGTSTYFAYF